jgi:NTP-dependent ternary conflict system VMAP-like protein/effector-associated domain 1 (EAD1)-containing protein
MLMQGFGSCVEIRSTGLRHPERIHDVIQWSGERDRHDQLVRVARRENPDNPQLRELDKHLGTSIRTEHLVELERLVVVDPLDREAVLDAAMPFDVGWSVLAEPEDMRTAFRRNADWLASLPRAADCTLPLYTFGYELARRVGREAEVRDWAGSLRMGELRLPQSKPTKALYLFVKCRPAYATGERLDQVHVEMWLWQFDEAGISLGDGPKKVGDYTKAPVLFEQVPGLISAVRKGLSSDLKTARDNLQIALCLSQTALPVEVERWTIEVGKTWCAIGSWYPVSIRSYERLYGGREDTWGRWGRQWERIQSRADNLPVSWFDESISDMDFTATVLRRDMVCAALTHASGVALVASTIDAGIPAVIWTRGSQHGSSEVRSRLEPMLAGCLADLPRLFHQRRAEQDLFDRIAILWEPFDLRPPDTWEFAAPDRL